MVLFNCYLNNDILLILVELKINKQDLKFVVKNAKFLKSLFMKKNKRGKLILILGSLILKIIYFIFVNIIFILKKI